MRNLRTLEQSPTLVKTRENPPESTLTPNFSSLNRTDVNFDALIAVRGQIGDCLGMSVATRQERDGSLTYFLGAPCQGTEASPGAGAVYVVNNKELPFNANFSRVDIAQMLQSGSATVITHNISHAYFGTFVAVGEVGGVPYLAVSAPASLNVSPAGGSVYGLLGDLRGKNITTAQIGNVIEGFTVEAPVGRTPGSLSFNGNLLAIGDPGRTSVSTIEGRAYVLHVDQIPTNGTTIRLDQLSLPHRTLIGVPGDQLGHSVHLADCVFGEGEPALVVGAPNYGGRGISGGAGMAYIIGLNGLASENPVLLANSSNPLILRLNNDPSTNSEFGRAVTVAKLDGGKSPYVLVGAPWDWVRGIPFAGTLFARLGGENIRTNPTLRITGSEPMGLAGQTFSTDGSCTFVSAPGWNLYGQIYGLLTLVGETGPQLKLMNFSAVGRNSGSLDYLGISLSSVATRAFCVMLGGAPERRTPGAPVSYRGITYIGQFLNELPISPFCPAPPLTPSPSPALSVEAIVTIAIAGGITLLSVVGIIYSRLQSRRQANGGAGPLSEATPLRREGNNEALGVVPSQRCRCRLFGGRRELPNEVLLAHPNEELLPQEEPAPRGCFARARDRFWKMCSFGENGGAPGRAPFA